MRSDERKFVRAVVRRVHPDLFVAHPQERLRNSESLKLLNAYCDDVARGRRSAAAQLHFWVRGSDGCLVSIVAQLTAHGCLAPLFLAFGLITEGDLRAGTDSSELGGDINFLEWLSSTVAEAARAAEQHESLKRMIRELRAVLEERHQLAAVQVGAEFAVSAEEQRRQLAALKTLDAVLSSTSRVAGGAFSGLSIRLYHPDSCTFDTFSSVEEGGRLSSGPGQSFVADDGCLHIVAERGSIREALDRLDLARARLLTRLTLFWIRRVRELSPALAALLGVDALWCDTRTEAASQKFVLWAGAVLEQRHAFDSALSGRRFTFSVLVHSDAASALVHFLESSSVLQVRADCPPAQLLEFLCSEAGTVMDRAAEQVADARVAEEVLLGRVRQALGAKHVIRVCSSYDMVKVMAAAQRLLDNAAHIRSWVDLSGASIAIDDCYELWGSGFISIPHNFQVEELQSQLQQKLLGSQLLAARAHPPVTAHPRTPILSNVGWRAESSGDGSSWAGVKSRARPLMAPCQRRVCTLSRQRASPFLGVGRRLLGASRMTVSMTVIPIL